MKHDWVGSPLERPLGCWRWVRWWPDGSWTPCSMVWRWGSMGRMGNMSLVGGLEHEFYFPINIGLLIIPIDFHIFQRGGPTTNQESWGGGGNWVRFRKKIQKSREFRKKIEAMNSRSHEDFCDVSEHILMSSLAEHHRWFMGEEGQRQSRKLACAISCVGKGQAHHWIHWTFQSPGIPHTGRSGVVVQHPVPSWYFDDGGEGLRIWVLRIAIGGTFRINQWI